MTLLAALRRVLANIRDGLDPAAVRTDVPSVPSQAYRDRMAAVEQTERTIDALAGQLTEPLQQLLRQTVVHLEQPVLDLRTLAGHVASHRQARSLAIARGGLVPVEEDTRYLEQLAALQQRLEALASAPDGARPVKT